MRDEEPERLADQLEGEADKLKEAGDRLEGQVHDVRQDWERKRADPAVPGAVPDEGSEDDDQEQEHEQDSS